MGFCSESKGDEELHGQTRAPCVPVGQLRLGLLWRQDQSDDRSLAQRMSAAPGVPVESHQQIITAEATTEKLTDPQLFLLNRAQLMGYVHSPPWRYHLYRAVSAQLQPGRLAQYLGYIY